MVKVLFFGFLLVSNHLSSNAQNCGVSKIGKGNIFGGNRVERGQFPWLASILKSNDEGKFSLICGGSLVSNKFILTAAHCMLNKHSTTALIPRQILINLGGYNLDNNFEPGRQTFSPIKINIHPDWNHLSLNYDADIALLEIDQTISYTDYIQPICFWKSTSLSTSIGTIVGYGKSEDNSKKHENIPKSIDVPIHTQEKCFLTQPDLARLSLTRTFCAGKGDGNGVCSGDSGGGLYVKSNNVYYLYGIVSSSLQRDGTCDLNNFAVFTNVLKYYTWIYQILRFQSQSQYVPTTTNSIQIRTTHKPAIVASPNQNYEVCGVMTSSTGLIQNGKYSTREEFPWVVSITISNNEYNTSGAIISQRHIVGTCSDMSYNSNNRRVPHDAWRYNVYSGGLWYNDPNSKKSGVSKISLHPVCKNIGEPVEGFIINDLGILTLNDILRFSPTVRPVCLWSFNSDINLISKYPIYAAGHGLDENGLESKRKYARLSIVSSNDCKNAFLDKHATYGGKNYFCMKGSNYGSACEFDNHIYIKVNERWYLRGVLREFTVHSYFICDISKPLFYEDTVQNVGWIMSQIGS